MNYGIEMLKVLSSLIVILALFYFIVQFLKKKRNYFNSTNQMKVLEKCYLNADQILYLVKIVDKVWLISTTKTKIEFIKEVDLSDFEVQEDPNLLNIFKKGKDGFNEE